MAKLTKNSEKPTLESLWTYLRETSKEFKQMVKETDRQLKETDRQLKETDRQLKASMKKTDEELRKVIKEIGGIGNSNGDMAEEYFQNAFKKSPKLNGEKFDEVDFNVRPRPKKGQKSDEYDIVLVNGKSVALIEIKYHLKRKDMDEALGKAFSKIETFKAFYPEYENYKFYLGMASLSFKENVEDIIQKAGIAVIKQVGNKMVINSENLKVF